MLDNVKNIVGHDLGKTFSVIARTLDNLGYWISDITCRAYNIEDAITDVRNFGVGPIVIDAKRFLPQHRERLVLVCIRRDFAHERFTLRNI